MNESPEKKSKIQLIKKIFHEIFFSPIDSFDIYINNPIIKKLDLLFFHMLIWLYAPFFKILHNLINHFFFQDIKLPIGESLKTGLLLSFVVYPIIFLFFLVLDSFRKNYQDFYLTSNENFENIYLITLPFSASVVFWIFPKPINGILIFLTFFYTMRLYYISLLNFNKFERIDFYKMLIYFLIFLGLLSCIAIYIGNSIRASV
jgi:hypothetical protein